MSATFPLHNTTAELFTITDNAPQPFIRYIDVDPEMAREWLTHNTDNRALRVYRVKQYGRDMVEGRWTVSADLICFDVDRRLVNGQHRLAAVIVSGTVQRFAVQFNTPVEAHSNLDTGVARTAADHLRFQHEAQPQLLAAAVRLAYLWHSGAIYSSTADQSVSSGEIDDFLAANPDLRHSVRTVARNRSRIDSHPSPIAVAHFRIAKANDVEEADAFIERLSHLVGEPKGSPVLALHSRLRQIRRNRTRIHNREYLAMIVKAFNYDVAGRKVTTIAATQRGDFKIPEPLTRTR